MKAFIVLMLFCAISTCSSSSSRNCPTAEWFVAEFAALIDQVVSPSVFIASQSPDIGLSLTSEM